ncbi:hypothetical protein KSP40_PGU021138 [Platanthera guangdongensis]|uniref:glycerophosphodiester phosphodiesterase n=1 Tax=Platanthera guangdongensis TaxID=2320717 RepID=A0ABR2MNP0_9ASPA
MISRCILITSSTPTIYTPPATTPPSTNGKSTGRRRFSRHSADFCPISKPPMALKAAAVADIPALDQVHERVSSISLSSPCPRKPARFAVIGHRGNGMNSRSSPSVSVRENSILSFNQAAKFSIPFVEFDVQVTGDGVPVIFHDVFILTGDVDAVADRRVTDLSLDEFLSYGSQREPTSPGKPLLRRTADGKVYKWAVEADDPLCTLEEAFRRVDSRLGFNIELKFDDDLIYTEENLVKTLEIIVRSVCANAGGRSVIFSTFQPDAARIVRRLQRDYPVFFLTDGGTKSFSDARRNSLEEAVKLCAENGLEGIVSEVRGVLRNPAAVAGIKKAKLSLLTYGGLNNTAEVVYMQYMMGIDGVIADRVKEISDAVGSFQGQGMGDGGGVEMRELRPSFSEAQLSYLLELIAELVKQ